MTLLLVVSIFLWKPNVIIAIGVIVFTVGYNIEIYLKFFENGQQNSEVTRALIHASFYLGIAPIPIIFYGFYKNLKLKQLKFGHLHPILSVTALLATSLIMQYLLRIL